MAQRTVRPEDRAEVLKHVGILRDFAPAAGITIKSVVPLFDKGMTGYTLDPMVAQLLRDQLITMRKGSKFGTPFSLSREVRLSLIFFHVIPEKEQPAPEGPPRMNAIQETTFRDLTTLGPESHTHANADPVPEGEKESQQRAAFEELQRNEKAEEKLAKKSAKKPASRVTKRPATKAAVKKAPTGKK